MGDEDSAFDELHVYQWLLRLTYFLAVITFIQLCFVAAPYGRHVSIRWGPTMNARVGWVVMESFAPLVCSIAYFGGQHSLDRAPLLLYSMFMAHYLHRAFVFPLLMKAGQGSQRMPILVAALACLWNVLNGYLQGRWLSHFGTYENSWLYSICFLAGLTIFLGGMALNLTSDSILRGLRGDPGSDYKIPHSGLFELVSCPNYFGEIVEWFGWAVATRSQAGLAFAVFTAANLIPRALAHHHWYRQKFANYPPRRHAVIPFLL